MYWSGRASYCGGDRAGLRNRSEARRLPSTTTGSGLKAIHDRKTFSSRACSCRDYGKHGHDRRRGNDCVDGNAADRGAAGPAQSLLWVFSSFLLTQTATTVVFGKLADIYGRKPVLVFGIALFLTASVLAGFAWSMPSMIVFRLLQGVGAGAIQPAAMTVVADLFPERSAARFRDTLQVSGHCQPLSVRCLAVSSFTT